MDASIRTGMCLPRRSIRSIARSSAFADDAIVIGAFVAGLKLSRRCLALWREVLGAFHARSSPFPDRARVSPGVLPDCRRRGNREGAGVVPAAGGDDEENQARYALVDFVLDPMPYGGVNGTLRRSTWACRS